MASRSAANFVAGMLVGLLVATAGFAFYVRVAQSSSDRQRGVIVLKLAHGLDKSHPVHAAMERFAERVAELSGGRVEIQIFPNGQLGNETESIEQLQSGALAMTKTSAAPMESFVPEMAVFGVPYVFRDADHYWRVLEGDIGQRLLQAGRPHGLLGLCYYDAGARSFYTVDKPVLSPDDLVGQKIRVQKSRTAMEMVKVLGGAPTPIPWGELYTALQQRMIDGAENNVPSFYSNRHFEVARHFSLDEHTMVPDILMISTRVWDGLTPEVQNWILESARESSVWQRELWKKKTAEDLAAVEAQGVHVYHPERQPFIDKVQPMHARYRGTPVGDLLQQIREVD
jgi:tripartite ATP-independent transporter DctP family solute receptor